MSLLARQQEQGLHNDNSRNMRSFVRQGYGCMDQRNSLLVVLPGETRVSLGYCARCTAGRCVFLPSFERPPVVKKRCSESSEAKKRSYQRATAGKRARGLAANGKPLRRSCWNCRQICRLDGTGFVCSLALDERPASAGIMRGRYQQAEECEVFDLRLVVEIGELEEAA